MYHCEFIVINAPSHSEHNRIMGSAHSNIMYIMYSLPFKLIRTVAGMHHLVDSFVSLHQTQNDKNNHNESNYQNNNNDCRERGVMTINDSNAK